MKTTQKNVAELSDIVFEQFRRLDFLPNEYLEVLQEAQVGLRQVSWEFVDNDLHIAARHNFGALGNELSRYQEEQTRIGSRANYRLIIFHGDFIRFLFAFAYEYSNALQPSKLDVIKEAIAKGEKKVPYLGNHLNGIAEESFSYGWGDDEDNRNIVHRLCDTGQLCDEAGLPHKESWPRILEALATGSDWARFQPPVRRGELGYQELIKRTHDAVQEHLDSAIANEIRSPEYKQQLTDAKSKFELAYRMLNEASKARHFVDTHWQKLIQAVQYLERIGEGK